MCECGRNLIGSITGSAGTRVYRCAAKTVHEKTVVHSAKRIETQFTELLDSLSTSKALLSKYTQAANSTIKLAADEARCKERELINQRSGITRERSIVNESLQNSD